MHQAQQTERKSTKYEKLDAQLFNHHFICISIQKRTGMKKKMHIHYESLSRYSTNMVKEICYTNNDFTYASRYRLQKLFRYKNIE